MFPNDGKDSKITLNPRKTPVFQGFFLFGLWKTLWKMWKTYVAYREK